MGAPEKKLSDVQELAIACLLTEPTRAAAATKAGVAPSTLYRWLNLKYFRRSYDNARRHVVESALNQVQGAMSDAVASLRECLRSDDPTIKLRAANVLLRHGLKGYELIDLQWVIRRIQDLKDEEKDKQGGGGL